MGSADVVFRWRKSSRSGQNGECVELGDSGPPTWRKSSRGGRNRQCVKLASSGAIRDSKNPDGPVIRLDIQTFVDSIRTGQFDR